ncbi:MAG: HAMP domain-containing sensor histidine kinase [Eubacteriales bacterium]|nr:HAMP domain-containing sensor histidine kinase [Eubacteriales bacterium]
MIKKLRRRFVIMTMSIITVILVSVFVAVFIFMRESVRSNANKALDHVIGDERIPFDGFEKGEKPPDLKNYGMPVLLFEIDASGQYSLVRGDVSEFSDETIEDMISQALASQTDFGELRDYSMSFARKDNTIAFVFTVSNENVMDSVLFICISVFVGTYALFFLLSILLSKWAVRPTELAWKAQRRFIADASHELKTPLTIILSNADMELQRGSQNEEHTSLIREEAMRMKSLIEQMLQMARLDVVDDAVKMLPVDLSQMVEGSLLSFEPILFENDVVLQSDIAPSLIVKGDEDKLRRMFEALLDNAAKYTPSGEKVIVSLSVNNKKRTMLTVRNTGVTLSKEQLEHIFERFYRAEDSRTTVGSFGLGLSIAQSIAIKHKTLITVDSSEELGVTFSVVFPCI